MRRKNVLFIYFNLPKLVYRGAAWAKESDLAQQTHIIWQTLGLNNNFFKLENLYEFDFKL